jgi:hypothetical protein
VPRVAPRPVAASKRRSVLLILVTAAIVVVASLPATRTWSQQQPRGTEQRLLFEPSALDTPPGTFSRRSTERPAGPAKPADDEARKTPEPRSFAPLQSNGALALPQAPRATTKFGVAAGDGPPQTKLGLETEHKFRPDELPNGEKTHGLSYQRELHVKPFLGLSLTSPIE